MRILVTGAAGFIGSHLCERLLADGHRVVGLDAMGEPHETVLKERNLLFLRNEAGFALEEADLRAARLRPLVRGADAVIHLAGRPGIRGREAQRYLDDNVLATRALLDACGSVRRPPRILFSSSSSLYGPAADAGGTAEDAPLAAASLYARSKLAAERLCARSRLGVTVLRYFTVYGPRQRPDMAFARFVDAALGGEPAPLFGDGTQVRDFTYVGDIVAGTRLALHRARAGRTYNLSGAAPVALADALERLAAVLDLPLAYERRPAPAHDARRTHADLARARRELGYEPAVGLDEGLRRQVAFMRTLAPARASVTA